MMQQYKNGIEATNQCNSTQKHRRMIEFEPMKIKINHRQSLHFDNRHACPSHFNIALSCFRVHLSVNFCSDERHADSCHENIIKIHLFRNFYVQLFRLKLDFFHDTKKTTDLNVSLYSSYVI